jgi:hypothetical protein
VMALSLVGCFPPGTGALDLEDVHAAIGQIAQATLRKVVGHRRARAPATAARGTPDAS